MRIAKCDHATSKPVDLLVPFKTGPVNPTGFIVLAVSVVISALRAAEFVAAQEHRYAARDQQGQKKVLNLAFPQGLDSGIRRFAFGAIVLAEVGVGTVMVVFSVCFIVLVAITHHVVQSEAVVAGDEVDAALGAFARIGIDVGTPADAAGKQTEHPLIAAPEAPDIIPVSAVPLRPTPL